MSHQHFKIVYRLLNIWLGFLVVIILSSYLPHWENINIFTWMVYAFNFWVFLSAVTIAMRDPFNKDIFINLGALFFINAISVVNIFIGNDYLFGSNKIGYLVYQYNTILCCLLYHFCILFILIKLIFRNVSVLKRYMITMLIIAGVTAVLYLPYFLSPTHAFKSQAYFLNDLFKRTFHLNMLSLVAIIYYGIYVYVKNRNLGEYINLIVAYFFIATLAELIDDLSNMYSFRIYGMRLYIITANIMFISVILYKKLIYTHSEFGQFYENLIAGRFGMGNIKIIPRNQGTNRVMLNVFKIYVHQRRYYLLTLLLMLTIGISSFELPPFFTLNLIALALGIGIILLFYMAIYKKQEKQKHYL